MGHNQAKIDKFRFQYNQVEFEVIVLIERAPFELLFGVIGYNFSFAQSIPNHYSGRKNQPHEIAIYKRRNVPEVEKIYFCGWKFYIDSDRHARNFEKTKEWLGNEAYEFCRQHDISSCWTDKKEKRKEYYTPQSYYNDYKK